MRGRTIAAASVFVVAGQVGSAAAVNYPGVAEFRYGVWTSDRSLTDATDMSVGTISAKANIALSAATRLRIDGIAIAEHRSSTSASERSEIREAMFIYDTSRTEWRLGWQTFAWGRADRINPTDVLTARNYRLLVPEDEEQRRGAPALSANLAIAESWRLIAIVQRFTRSRMPSDDHETQFSDRARGSDREWAVKLDRTGAHVDWSVSYFNGREKSRSLVLANCLDALPIAFREHARVQMLGVDAASTFRGYGIRTELARVEAIDAEAPACGGRSDYTSAIAGVDRNIPGNTTVGMQWFVKRYHDDVSPPAELSPALGPTLAQFQAANGQTSPTRSGITLRYRQGFLNDRVDLEWAMIYLGNTRNRALRPRLIYRATDRLRIVLGADRFRGDADSPFGLIKRNSGGFMQVHVDLP